MTNFSTPGLWHPPFQGAHAPYLAWTDASGTRQTLVFDLVSDEQWDENTTVTEHPVETGSDVADHVRVELRKCSLKVFVSNEPIDRNQWDEAAQTDVSLDLPVSRATMTAPGTTLIVPQWNSQIDARILASNIGGALVGGAVGAAGGGAVASEIAGAATSALVSALFQPYRSEVPVSITAGLTPPTQAPVKATVQTWPGGQDGTDYVAKMRSLLATLKDTAQQLTVVGSKNFCEPMVIESLSFVRDEDSGTGMDVDIGLKEMRVVSTQTVAAPIPNLPAGGGTPPNNKGDQNVEDAPPADQKSVFLQSLQWLGLLK